MPKRVRFGVSPGHEETRDTVIPELVQNPDDPGIDAILAKGVPKLHYGALGPQPDLGEVQLIGLVQQVDDPVHVGREIDIDADADVALP